MNYWPSQTKHGSRQRYTLTDFRVLFAENKSVECIADQFELQRASKIVTLSSLDLKATRTAASPVDDALTVQASAQHVSVSRKTSRYWNRAVRSS